jgi:hypothetical protein
MVALMIEKKNDEEETGLKQDKNKLNAGITRKQNMLYSHDVFQALHLSLFGASSIVPGCRSRCDIGYRAVTILSS